MQPLVLHELSEGNLLRPKMQEIYLYAEKYLVTTGRYEVAVILQFLVHDLS